VVGRLRDTLSLRDLAELFLERGFTFTSAAGREWEARFAPLITDQLRSKRTGQAGRSWYVAETDIQGSGGWKYLYRAIDRDGNLVDVSASTGIWMAPSRASTKQLRQWATLQTGERRMAMPRIPVLSAKRWARTSSTVPARSSTIDLNKITAASNNAITRCAGWGTSMQQPASAADLMNSGSTFGCAPRCANVCLR
jgi:hypothetical protein